MHHWAAVMPEPECHFHPSFSNRSLSPAREARLVGGEEEGKMDGVGTEAGVGGGREEEEDGREEGRREEERREGPRQRRCSEWR